MATYFSHRSIPQLQNQDSERLRERINKTRFAFRVFDKQSQGTYDEEAGFVAAAFCKGQAIEAPPLDPHASVVSHVNRTYTDSPWISASRQWDWAVWEMCRRQQRFGNDTDIRIAVVDVYALTSNSKRTFRGQIIHALQFLNPLKLDGSLKTLENFANIADELLFYGSIPAHAVVSVVRREDLMCYVPGHDTGWFKSTSFRDAHWAMRRDWLSRINWDPNSYSLQCANLALSLLRPVYHALKCQTWSIFFDVIDNSSLLIEESESAFKAALAIEPMQTLAERVSELTVQDSPISLNTQARTGTPESALELGFRHPANRELAKRLEDLNISETQSAPSSCSDIEFSWAGSSSSSSDESFSDTSGCCQETLNNQIVEQLSAASSEITKSFATMKLSLLLLKEDTIETTLHTAYTQSSVSGSSKTSSTAEREDCVGLIYFTAANLLAQHNVILTPDIRHQTDQAQRKLEDFKEHFLALAGSAPFSHVSTMKDADWAVFKARIVEAVDAKLRWLQEIIQLLRRPEHARRELWLKETSYAASYGWFQP
ncbi:hypothetical protein FRC07_002002 [Ceratobasidium sp. 392]|nr:hypothetical protein FRC07_002002 [Ceratobasidium sp. 392]